MLPLLLISVWSLWKGGGWSSTKLRFSEKNKVKWSTQRLKTLTLELMTTSLFFFPHYIKENLYPEKYLSYELQMGVLEDRKIPWGPEISGYIMPLLKFTSTSTEKVFWGKLFWRILVKRNVSRLHWPISVSKRIFEHIILREK